MSKRTQETEYIEAKAVRMVPEGFALSELIGSEKASDRLVFLTGAYPGEIVRAKITEKKRGYLKAETTEVISNAFGGRIKQSCPHFNPCAGCRFLDCDYESRLNFKKDMVIDAFRHIGRMPDANILDVLPSPEITRHRNKMEFSFGEDEQGNLILGLRPAGDWRNVIPVPQCNLLPEGSNEFIEAILQMLAQSGYKSFNTTTKEGFLRYLTLRYNSENEFLAYICVGDSSHNEDLTAMFTKLSEDFPNLFGAGLFISSNTGASAQGETVTLIGNDYLMQKIGDVSFRVSPTSFFQTNTKGSELLAKEVEKALKTDGVLWDLFSGTGALSLPLSSKFKKIYGAELVEEAVDDANMNAKRNGIGNVEYIALPTKKALTALSEISFPSAVIFDPPRCGVGAKLMKKIAETAPPEIVYVSCNPVTLAQDIKDISDFYTLEYVQPVDMFPHTYHIECVARLVRK